MPPQFKVVGLGVGGIKKIAYNLLKLSYGVDKTQDNSWFNDLWNDPILTSSVSLNDLLPLSGSALASLLIPDENYIILSHVQEVGNPITGFFKAHFPRAYEMKVESVNSEDVFLVPATSIVVSDNATAIYAKRGPTPVEAGQTLGYGDVIIAGPGAAADYSMRISAWVRTPFTLPPRFVAMLDLIDGTNGIEAF